MNSKLLIENERMPFFGFASVSMPFIGAVACVICYYSPSVYSEVLRGGDAGAGAGLAILFVAFVAVLLGLIFAGISIFRHERYRWLSGVGLFLNLSPIIYAKLCM